MSTYRDLVEQEPERYANEEPTGIAAFLLAQVQELQDLINDKSYGLHFSHNQVW